MDTLYIEGNQLHKQHLIGRGGHASVYLYVDDTDKEYAVKIYQCDYIDYARDEVAYLERVKGNDLICKIHGHYVDSNLGVAIIMEKYWPVVIDMPSAFNSCLIAFTMFLRPLVQVHRAGIVHGDVKCMGNYVLNEHNIPVIIDFGNSIFIYEDCICSYTPPFVAPETFIYNKDTSTYATDTWALMTSFILQIMRIDINFMEYRRHNVLQAAIDSFIDNIAHYGDIQPIFRNFLTIDPTKRNDSAAMLGMCEKYLSTDDVS